MPLNLTSLGMGLPLDTSVDWSKLQLPISIFFVYILQMCKNRIGSYHYYAIFITGGPFKALLAI